MYQQSLINVIAKSALPRTVQDYNAALTSAANSLNEIDGPTPIRCRATRSPRAHFRNPIWRPRA